MDQQLDDLINDENGTQKQVLIKEFQSIDLNFDQRLTKDDLYSKLDSKLGKRFERVIADQLVAKLETDGEGRFAIEQVIQIIVEAEFSIIQKIKSTHLSLLEYRQKRADVCKKYEIQRAKEQHNEFNVMIGSLLSFRAIETTLKKDPPTIIKIQCGSQSQSPLWSESTQFGTEDLTVGIFESDQEEPLGIADIQLIELKDQQKVEKWVDLVSISDIKSRVGKIKLELQWIHSNSEFLKDVITRWNEEIVQLEEDVSGYRSDLYHLLEPFPLLTSIIIQVDKYLQKQTSEYVSSFSAQNQNKRASFTEDQKTLIEREGEKVFSKKHLQVLLIHSLIEQGEVFKALWYSNIIYVALAMIISFQRAVFLDILMAMSYFVEVHLKSENRESQFQIYSIGILASLITEILWVIIETIKWWESMAPEWILHRVIVISSFFFIVIKITLAALYLFVYSDLKRLARDEFKDNENMVYDNVTYNSFAFPDLAQSFARPTHQANIHNINTSYGVPQQLSIQNSAVNIPQASFNNSYQTHKMNPYHSGSQNNQQLGRGVIPTINSQYQSNLSNQTLNQQFNSPAFLQPYGNYPYISN